MTHHIQNFGETIIKTQNTLTDKVTSLRNQSNSDHLLFLQSRVDESHHDEEVKLLRSELFNYIGDAIINRDASQAVNLISDWGHRAGITAVNYDIPMESLVESTRLLRQVLMELIQTEAEIVPLTVEDIFFISSIIHPLIDHCIYSLSLEYIKYNQEVIEMANQSIKALSAPVIPITNNIAILPIMAELNSYRSMIIMEKLLKRVTELKLNYLIIDLSGLVRIDHSGVNRLYQVVKTLKLLGVNPYITGIPPTVAQTMVKLGITITDVPIMGTLQQAILSLGISIN